MPSVSSISRLLRSRGGEKASGDEDMDNDIDVDGDYDDEEEERNATGNAGTGSEHHKHAHSIDGILKGGNNEVDVDDEEGEWRPVLCVCLIGTSVIGWGLLSW